MQNNTLFEKGRKVRRAVMGEAFEQSIAVAEDEFSRPIRELTTKYVWGEIWSRKGLPRKTRRLLNIGVLIALKCHSELKLHIRGARNDGCTKKEIREVLMHCGVYCGVPALSQAVRCAREVFAEEKRTRP